jgi:hypothetical protein
MGSPSADDEIRDFFEIDRGRAHAAPVTDAFDDFAIAVDLTELALSVGLIAPVDHETFDDETDTRPNAKTVLGQDWCEHRIPLFNQAAAASICTNVAECKPIDSFF